MGALGYFLALPVLYGIALLPFPALYLLSDLLHGLLFSVLRYRRNVVLTNLRNSFPEKSDVEIKVIAGKFQHWFCDLTLETLKTLTMSPRELRERVTFEGVEILRHHAEQKQSVILVLGHFGNWELAGARYSIEPGLPPLYVIYHPLQNKWFDALVYRMRTRHGTRLYTMKEAAKSMMRDRHLNTATAFIADQTPAPERALWMTFLNQDTPIFPGTENLSRKLGYPVLYISITRPQRGHYRMVVENLVAEPGATSEGEITRLHTNRLERDIVNYPDLWLWTHRRWKHKRPRVVS